jgi:hypothetical protein
MENMKHGIILSVYRKVVRQTKGVYKDNRYHMLEFRPQPCSAIRF